MIAEELREFNTPRGTRVVFSTRPDTIDYDICAGLTWEDEYKLASLPSLTGLAIDVGAYIGTAAVILALEHPGLRVKAVEIVPENVDAIRRNIALNGVEDRVEVVHKAAGGPDEASRTCYMRHRSYPTATDGYVAKSRFVGNSFWSPGDGEFDADAVDTEVVSLSDLADDRVSFIKIDAEGAEWQFLADPAIKNVDRIYGEYHWDYRWQGDASTKKPNSPKRPQRKDNAQAEMARLLGKTHVLTMDTHPTLGHFEAVRA